MEERKETKKGHMNIRICRKIYNHIYDLVIIYPFTKILLFERVAKELIKKDIWLLL